VLVSAIMVVLGVAVGLMATVVLPHIYAAQTTIHYNLSNRDGTDDNADRTLTTQTVLITGRDVLQPVSDSTSVPIDYLTKNVTATVVPNSEIIQIQVTHPDRTSGIQLANAVAQRYLQLANANGPQAQLQAQLDAVQRQLANPATPADTVADLQSQIGDLQSQLATNAATTNVASTVAPAYSVTSPVFPNTLITLGLGAVAGALLAGLIGSRMVRNWTRR
jgi:uncharacterized protein involved in exopolysaccharide biosynthesis